MSRIMAHEVNNALLFIIWVTVLTANYIHANGSRLHNFQRTFYEKGREAQDSHPSEPQSDAHQTHQSSQNLTAIRLANEHFLQIRTQYRCRTPRPKLIRVKDYYNVPSKEYLPRCTVLHQCDDESGCCELSSMHCAPQQTQTIELQFYVIEAGIKENNSGGGGSTESLAFINHTRCHCIEINYMPRNKALANTIQPSIAQKPALQEETTTLASTASESHSQLCKWVDCPQPFHPRFRASDQRCICDCFDRDKDCIRIKRGRDRLAPMEARCVRGGICLEPECDLGGTFSRQDAICTLPKHHLNTINKYRAHAQRHQHHKPQQHWLSERD